MSRSPKTSLRRLFVRTAHCLSLTLTLVLALTGAALAEPPIKAGATVTVSVSNGPGNRGDWVGLFRVGVRPTSFSTLAWAYLSGNQHQPPSGTSAAKLTFVLPSNLSDGQYEFRFYPSDQYFTLLAASDPFTVGSGGSGIPEIVAAPLQAGGSETISISGGPGNPNDLVGLYPVGADDGREKSLAWGYLNGTQAAPSAGASSATFNFPMPSNLSPGPYEFRLFAKDDFKAPLAASQPINVGSSSQIYCVPDSTQAGSSVNVSVSGGPGNRNDWVGLFRVGAPATGFYTLAWAFLSGTHDQPTTATGVAKFPFTLPSNLSPGQYEFRFYGFEQYFTLLAASDPVTVGSGGSGMPRVTATPLQAGRLETISVSGGPGNPNDWVGLYRVGAYDDRESSLAWDYLNGTQVALSTGTSSARFNFPMPSNLDPGFYEFRFFAKDDFKTPLAASQPIKVGSGPQIQVAF